ncbi:hypothetical protein NLG97_g9148 [Lecanicillium saksenae]|uniref:Uncharacterized protein n=1 Tax=Lecanicillium saksenae TaxID=468837 RepID=A0ACC1QGV4_9HYPO|nr:hypothetical protein NLG97_g9148 [Lecanicillium saksenae]
MTEEKNHKSESSVVEEQAEAAIPQSEHGEGVRRKLDMYLGPILILIHTFHFLARSALNSAAVMDIRTDLRLSGGDYSWCSAIYYLGYLVASYPAAWLMVRMPIAKFMVASIERERERERKKEKLIWGLLILKLTIFLFPLEASMLWGAMTMLMALPHNAAGLLTLRFLLGVFEAPLGPGLAIIVTMFYKRSEQPLRHAVWFAGNGLAGTVGGIMAYGIGHVHSMAPWKASSLGLPHYSWASVAWSAVALVVLPDTPAEARFLSKAERAAVVRRVNDNMTGIRNNEFKWYQVREALLDAKTWFMVTFEFAAGIANGATNFSTIVTQGFGFSELNTLLLLAGEYFSQLCFILAVCWLSSRVPNSRAWRMAACMLMGILSALLIRQLPPHMKWGRYAGVLLRAGFVGYFPLLMAVASGNTAGYTKKTITNAMVGASDTETLLLRHAIISHPLFLHSRPAIFVAFCCGNIVGPQLYFQSEAPSYPSGFLSLMICLGVSFVTVLGLRFHLYRENKRRDALGPPAAPGSIENEDFDAMDLTDKEMPQFRYVY